MTTVLIPAYEAAAWIGAAVRSALAQEGVLEVVVVDDGSSDDTAATAAAFGPPVRVLRQDNGGPGVARNLAVHEARGELLLFLDADDILVADGLSRRAAVLAARAEVDMVFGQVRFFTDTDERGEPIGVGTARPAHQPGAMLIRRAAFERVGPFSEDRAAAESLDWLLRAREAGLREVTIPGQVLWRRVHGANLSFQRSAQRDGYLHALKASIDRRRAVEAGS
jgi:glycosyltransferase involved in cell wall biosynthesis